MKIAWTALAAALALASGANAATFVLNQDNCTGGCFASPATDAGSIYVTAIAGGLHVDIELGPNIFFNQAGQGHDALGFDLSGDPTVSLQNIVDAHSLVTAEVATNLFGAPPVSESGTGDFNHFSYGFDWQGVGNNGSLFTTGIDRLTFDIIDPSLTLGSLDGNGHVPNIFFTVDVARLNADHVAVATGVVGATLLTGGVPEPATWGLMIVGFGGVGAALRRRRAQSSLAAVA